MGASTPAAQPVAVLARGAARGLPDVRASAAHQCCGAAHCVLSRGDGVGAVAAPPKPPAAPRRALSDLAADDDEDEPAAAAAARWMVTPEIPHHVRVELVVRLAVDVVAVAAPVVLAARRSPRNVLRVLMRVVDRVKVLAPVCCIGGHLAARREDGRLPYDADALLAQRRHRLADHVLHPRRHHHAAPR